MLTRSAIVRKLEALYPNPGEGDAEMVVRLLLATIAERLAGGGRVEIRGFGSFQLSERVAYIARNPRTGEKVEVKAKAVPRFKPGRELRARIDPSNVRPGYVLRALRGKNMD